MRDSYIIITAQIGLSLFYALILFLIHRIYPELKGIVYLIGGFLTASLEQTFYALPAIQSLPYLYGFLGNYLSLIALALFYVGILRHLGSPRSPKLVWTIVSAAIVSAAILAAHATHWRLFTGPDVGCIVCIALAVICVIFAMELFRSASQRKLIRAFAFFMAMYAPVNLNHMFLGTNFFASVHFGALHSGVDTKCFIFYGA